VVPRLTPPCRAPCPITARLHARRYLLFAAEPYETIAFKVPALEVDRDPSRFFTHWDAATKTFTLQLHFRTAGGATGATGGGGGGGGPRGDGGGAGRHFR